MVACVRLDRFLIVLEVSTARDSIIPCFCLLLQLLISVYNPNAADVAIKSGTAILKHKHTEVGSIVIDPFVAAGGYVTDILSTVAINAKQVSANEDRYLFSNISTFFLPCHRVQPQVCRFPVNNVFS